jgi:hypothetical protein
MSEEIRSLNDILFVCVFRYGVTEDNRFALTALVTYQALQGVLRERALGYVQGKLKELQDRVGNDCDDTLLNAFTRSRGLIEALKVERARRYDSYNARIALNRVAPDLLKAIETYDLRAVYSFLKPEYVLQAVA